MHIKCLLIESKCDETIAKGGMNRNNFDDRTETIRRVNGAGHAIRRH